MGFTVSCLDYPTSAAWVCVLVSLRHLGLRTGVSPLLGFKICCFLIFFHSFFLIFGFPRHGFSLALEPVLELAVVDLADVEVTEICLCLPSAEIKGMPHTQAVGFLIF